MANLWVVTTGLAVLVEREGISNNPYMVLLRQVPEGWKVPPGNGKEIPAHNPSLRLLPGSVEILIGNRDVKFLPDGVGTPEIDDPDPFLRVGRELTDALKVQKQFVGPRSASIDGWSRIVLPGPGTIWPIHVKKEFEIKTIQTQTGLKLVGAVDLEGGSTKPKNKPRVGNGLLYYRNIRADVPVAKFPDKEYTLEPTPDSEAKNLPVQNGEVHYVVWVANSGKDSGQGFDRDFFLLYDLLGVQIVRYVPMITKAKGFGVRTPPGQCMIGYAFGDS